MVYDFSSLDNAVEAILCKRCKINLRKGLCMECIYVQWNTIEEYDLSKPPDPTIVRWKLDNLWHERRMFEEEEAIAFYNQKRLEYVNGDIDGLVIKRPV